MKRIFENMRDHVLKPTITYKGYANIDLIRKPKRVHGVIHRTAAECFIPNPENKPFVYHINENKGDNS